MFDYLHLVQLPKGTSHLGHFVNIFLLLQGLHLILHLLLCLEELLHRIITLGKTPTKIIIGLFRGECIALLTYAMLVPALWIT